MHLLHSKPVPIFADNTVIAVCNCLFYRSIDYLFQGCFNFLQRVHFAQTCKIFMREKKIILYFDLISRKHVKLMQKRTFQIKKYLKDIGNTSSTKIPTTKIYSWHKKV